MRVFLYLWMCVRVYFECTCVLKFYNRGSHKRKLYLDLRVFCEDRQERLFSVAVGARSRESVKPYRYSGVCCVAFLNFK